MRTRKLTHSHNLPVTRLITVSFYNLREDQTVIIHASKSVYKSKDGDSYWQTNCGKSIENHHSVTQELLNSAIQFNQGVDTGVKFCPHCLANVVEYMTAFENERQYDWMKREEKRTAEDAERQARLVRWNTMVSFLKDEVARVFSNKKLKVEENNNSKMYYFIVRNGVSYKVTVSIEEEERN